MKRIIASLLVSFGLLAGASHAREDAGAELYDAAAPADSAFVRVLNLSDGRVRAMLGGKNQAQQIAAGQLGGYRFTVPGKVHLDVEGQSTSVDLAANTANTFVYDGSSLRLLQDAFINEPKKAQVGFYNLSGQTLSLKTADGKHAIVDSVAAGQNGSRMVNELKIAFAAYQGEQKIADFPEVFLKKGRTYSYLILPAGSDGVRALSMANGLDPLD
ncbi:alginate O-acetyltransferase AlgF [Pseudomonas mangrovi]|uniref:Alginate biosynthesis protein AlgF n=1 Tax=Pseudomonas mangrovi TaxID=2161748 RepID=A0A2T5P903_9PSED|nr:alginate O-acetyltransferase AlgF [Pseudomonas mangrovi]PTU74226.1 alginate O-acetyltransferase [Pseudomonas mangrovi]